MISHAHVMSAPVNDTLTDRFTNWMTRSLPWLARDAAMTYDDWSATFVAELGVVVMDDEGRRRCRKDGRLEQPLSRRQAEAYFLFNSLVKARRITA